VQLAPQAWSFSWQLISPEKSPEVQFFGAACLAIKVSRSGTTIIIIIIIIIIL
jgi:hypothetical protein